MVEGALQVRRRRDDDAVATAELGGVRVVGVIADRGGRIEPQDDRVHAVAQIVQDLRIDLGRIGIGVFLTNIPSGQRVA